MSIIGNEPGTFGLLNNDPSGGSDVVDTGLPIAPDAQSTTKNYTLERELIATQVGFEISFSTNSTGAFDNTKVSGLGYETTTARAGTSVRFYGTAGRTNGEAAGFGGADAGAVLYCSAAASAGSIEDKIDSWVTISESAVSLLTVIKVNASTIGVYSKTLSEDGLLPTLTGGGDDDFGGSITASSRATTIPEATWNEVSAGGTQTPGWYQLLTQGKKVGDQTGTIGSTGFTWSRRVTYLDTIYYRVVGTDQDGFYTDTTTSVIGTIVATAQREF